MRAWAQGLALNGARATALDPARLGEVSRPIEASRRRHAELTTGGNPFDTVERVRRCSATASWCLESARRADPAIFRVRRGGFLDVAVGPRIASLPPHFGTMFVASRG